MSETYNKENEMTTDSYMFDQIANPKMKTRTSHFGTTIEKGDKVAFVGLRKNAQEIYITIAHENDSPELFKQYEYEKKIRDIHVFKRKV